jgi:DNA-binding transcriptional ArsR family regulator
VTFRRGPKNIARTLSLVDVDVAPLASLFADATRSAVIGILMSGRAHSAGELAQVCGVSPSTMTGHLQRLLEAGAVEVRQQGRHRYFRLADPRVARAFEVLALASRTPPVNSLAANSQRAALAEARSCYDHLAGRLGCAVNAALLRDGALRLTSAGFQLTIAGARLLGEAGVDVEGARRRRRRFAYPCLDWTERREHLAGALGAAVLAQALLAAWVKPRPGSRALQITPGGRTAFAELFGLSDSGS